MMIIANVIIGGILIALTALRTAASVVNALGKATFGGVTYQPPACSLWTVIKILGVGIPLVIVAVWAGQWWFRESILKEFRHKQEIAQRVQLERDRIFNQQHDAELAAVRETYEAILDQDHKQDEINLTKIQSLQASLDKAGGWTPEVVNIIDGRAAPKVRAVVATKARRRRP